MGKPLLVFSLSLSLNLVPSSLSLPIIWPRETVLPIRLYQGIKFWKFMIILIISWQVIFCYVASRNSRYLHTGLKISLKICVIRNLWYLYCRYKWTSIKIVKRKRCYNSNILTSAISWSTCRVCQRLYQSFCLNSPKEARRTEIFRGHPSELMISWEDWNESNPTSSYYYVCS